MDQRTLLAIALSFVLLMFYQMFMETYYPAPPPAAEQQAPVQERAPAATAQLGSGVRVGKGPSGPALETIQPQQPAPGAAAPSLKPGKRTTFENGVSAGHVALHGGQLTDLRFLRHLDKLPPEGNPIRFLDSLDPFFFTESGFLATNGVRTPSRDSTWQLEGADLVEGNGRFKLTWDNGQNLQFEKSYTFVQDSYLFTVTDRVSNHSNKPVPLFHYTQFVRVQPEPEDGQAMAIADFQGPMGFLDGVRVQHDYDDIKTADQYQQANKGWIGFSDKYFLAALVPGNTASSKKFYFDFDAPTHRTGIVSSKNILEPGGDKIFTTRLFIGPKEIRNLEAKHLDLDRSVDYGWFHFLAVPLVQLLLFLNDYLHNYGLAIIFLTIFIKAIFYPLANKSYRSMSAMKKLQPKIEELRKLHSSDKQQLNQEMMKLYQENKVNPLGGCLPIVVQIPVFFALYKVLLLSVEMRHAPFFLWIHDLSVKDPYYVLPLLMGVSMFLQSKMNPAPADPMQAKIMMFLPVIFTFMFLSFPAGLVLYWLLNNVLSIAQQGYIMKQTGTPIDPINFKT